ncbi:crotonase/enoyl-CoA hydratase family protein [Nesterenkonia sp. F]|uniref:crotonase/enoyl-CoA hydratase family protein n=1 Tax=Nesterenkonia sp. F TaxID=795955 RepID=UPI000255D7C0|nr:crotonase/enoyl-CoA hydratase family protein [Nesterenkonia sp. F]
MTTTTTADSPVLTEARDGILIITIDRPQARNAVDAEVARGLAAAVDELTADDDLRVGVLTGAAGTFSAGMDLKAAARGESPSVEGRGFGGLVEHDTAKPLIAAVEGHALGGGFELALACDLVVAASGATFALPEVRRGFLAGGGGAVRLPRRIPHHLAMELLLTGRSVEADRASSLGLINAVTPDGEALAGALELAEEVAANAPLALAGVKQVVRSADRLPEPEAFAAQREVLAELSRSEDFAEGARAFAEKRAPQWVGR